MTLNMYPGPGTSTSRCSRSPPARSSRHAPADSHPGHRLLLVRPLRQRFHDGPARRCTAPPRRRRCTSSRRTASPTAAPMRVVVGHRPPEHSPSFTDTVVAVSTVHLPPVGRSSPAASIATNDTRMLNAEWRDGILVADHTVGLSTDSNAHARWYEFDVTGSPTLVQDGTISPARDQHLLPGDRHRPGRRDRHGVQRSRRPPSSPRSMTPAAPRPIRRTMETPGAGQGRDTRPIPTSPSAGVTTAASPSTRRPARSGARTSTPPSLLVGFPANWATWISHFDLAPSVVSSDPGRRLDRHRHGRRPTSR